MRTNRFLCFLAAAALAGCGGGGGGGASSVSLVPSAPPGGGSAESRGSDSGTVNEGILSENSLLAYSRQFAGNSQQQSSGSEEVYDPQTQSSVVRAFAQATLADATATRKKEAYLIASSSYGIAQAARDLLSGIGLGNNGYSFLDTSEKQTSNRSAYLETPEGSIVNILSNPLYTRRGSKLVGGLIISPDDIKSHGWIVSDTGFDGNIDPVAGITGRGWLRKHKADIEHGYRQAAATGKVRLFYGLKSDGQTRHAAANGCKGFEQYCLGTPYSLRVKNAQGRYIDVEGAFVSTYGFAAYVLAWERMPADTHISKVFELGDACAHDLGEAGADADTGLGRLDVGCMAGRIYQASVVVEEDEIEEEDVPAVVPPPVTVVVNPTPTVTVALEVKPTVAATISVPEDKKVPEEAPPVTVVVNPTPTVTVALEVKPTVAATISVPEDKKVPEEAPPVTVAVNPTPTVTVALEVKPTVAATISVPEDKKVPEEAPPVTVAVNPTPTVTVALEVKPTVSVTTSAPEVSLTVTVATSPAPTTTMTVSLMVVKETLTAAPKKNKVLAALSTEFSRLGIDTTTSRKENAYVIGLFNHENNLFWYDWWSSTLIVIEGHYYNWLYYNDWNIYGRITDIEGTTDLLSDMGISSEDSYTVLKYHVRIGGTGGPNPARQLRYPHLSYEDMYRTTSENSLINFVVNPVYLDAQGKGNKEFMPHAAEVWIDPKHISKHGWIVSGLKSRFFEAVPWIDDDDVKDTHHIEGYRQAVATGKVRLFYILNDEINCQDIEEYCIGVPYAFDAFDISIAATYDYFKYNRIQEQPPAREASDLAATYGYGVYLLAWERMPADTHISAIFAMGDKCTEDIGVPGPDANTGLGRLDIGCMASEVYKVRLDPTVATLSVAARKPSSPVVSVVADGTGLVSAAGSGWQQAQKDGPARQRFFDDFAQELFSDLGSLRLPGSTDANLKVGFSGDSFQGRYRPARDVRPHYQSSRPQPGYALVGGNLGVMGIGDGEIGIFARIEGLDVSFSYSRSKDFFGGAGSGQFEFDQVGNARLMLQKQLLSEDDDHSWMLGSWIRHAVVVSGKGALLDNLKGSEYGASVRHDWKRGDELSFATTAWVSRFAGGEVGLAGGSFGIASSNWQWGIGMVGTYEF